VVRLIKISKVKAKVESNEKGKNTGEYLKLISFSLWF
jgi:hypothetical protein